MPFQQLAESQRVIRRIEQYSSQGTAVVTVEFDAAIGAYRQGRQTGLSCYDRSNSSISGADKFADCT